jgi:hypothetical protein
MEGYMTQDEIIEMARQAGCPMANMMPMYFTDTQLLVMLEAFAKLVAEKEREALTPRCWTTEMNDAWNKAIPDLTLAFDELIRARGQAC